MNVSKHYDMELDEIYYNKLRDADFIEIDTMIFIKDHLKDLASHIENLRSQGVGKTEIEQELNHVIMEFVSTHYDKQQSLAKSIIEKWKEKLKSKFPSKKFVIELVDEGGSYVIYLYTKKYGLNAGS